MASNPQSSPEPRRVLVVNIEFGCVQSNAIASFDEMHHDLMQLLVNNPLLQVRIVNTVASLQATFSATKPDVLLFTNELVSRRPNLISMVSPFISAGGMVVLGGHFSSFTRPLHMKKFFSSLGLPWESSAYKLTTFGITNFGKSVLTGVDEQFCVRAFHLANVTPEQALYTPVVGSETQSEFFSREPTDPSLAMAALARIGAGAISYVGSVDAVVQSNRLTVALCLTSF